MRVPVHPRRWARRQTFVIVVLVLLNLIGQAAALNFHHDRLLGFVPQFDLDLESNVPSWYQGTTLFIAASLFALIASLERRQGRRGVGCWRLLAVGFAFMSLDEIANFHEFLRVPALWVRTTPAFHAYSWIFPALLMVGALALYLRPWILEMPEASRRQFLTAGAVYLCGAVAFEAIGGIEAMLGVAGWPYVLTYTVEETLEMVGVLLLIQAQLEHLHRRMPVVELEFELERPDAAPAGESSRTAPRSD
jgi:hypothetical protein